MGLTTLSVCVPIALAVKVVVPDTRVMVGTNDVQVGERYADLPTKARKFVYEFDNGWAVKPFNFNLKV